MAKDFLKKVCGGKVSYYNDFIKSPFIQKPINAVGELNNWHKHHKSTIDYFVIDRLRELKSIFWYFNNANASNMYIYKWDQSRNNRPYNSTINADYLIVFHNGTYKQFDGQTTSFFVAKKDKNNALDNTYSPVTIFPTDIPYWYDIDYGKKQEQVKDFRLDIVNKKTKSIKNIITVQQPQVNTNLEIQRYYKSLATEDFHKLNQKRKNLLKNPQNQKLLDDYKKKIERLGNLNTYGLDKLKYFQDLVINKIVELLPEQNREQYKNQTFTLDRLLELLKGKNKELDLYGKEYQYVKKCINTINNRTQNITFFSVNNLSIDDSGVIGYSQPIAVTLPDMWNNFKKNLKQSLQNAGDNAKLFFKSLGDDIKKIGSSIISPKASKSNLADRTDEIKADDATLWRINAQKQKGIDRSQKPNMKNGVIVPNKKLSQEQSKDRKPLQNEKKRGDDPRT